MLDSLDDEDGVEPEEGGDEGEECAVKTSKCSGGKFETEFFADRGEVFGSVALADEEENCDRS